MNIEEVRAKLDAAKDGPRGTLARIARESGVTYRTLLNIRKGNRETSAGTISLLSVYFKKPAVARLLAAQNKEAGK